MLVGIICAGDDEVAPFLELIENYTIIDKSMLRFYKGRIGNVDVVTLYSGVGKVNAAIATQILIDNFNCDIIVNSGTAGGISDSVDLFDTVVSTQTAYYDMDKDILTEFHPYLSEIWLDSDKVLLSYAKDTAKIFSTRVVFGVIVSGDKFIENRDRELIKQKFTPLCADMETAAVAHVCYVNKIPFISVRTITDTAAHSGKQNFENNCNKASYIAADFIKLFLANIKLA